MSYYIHQTPGRLRVRTPTIKDDPAMANAAQALFADVVGVRTVVANAKTGSVTIVYDVYTISSATLINELASNGYLTGIIGFPRPLPVPMLLPSTRVASAIEAPLLSPQARKWLGVAAKLLLPALAERAFGRSGKVIVQSLLA